MNPIPVRTNSRLHVTYSFHEAPQPTSDRMVVLHHGILHTRDHFLPLILQLNRLGIHAAMIDQQSEDAGFFRNCIGITKYREGMADAVRRIEVETKLSIGSYAFHSMGAMVGEEMQQQYPALRRPTVFMTPIPMNGALPISLRMLRRNPLTYLKAVLTLDIHSLARSPKQVRELFFDRLTPEPIVEEATAQLKHASFWMYCQLVLRPLVRPRISNDGLPKMLLYSETDEIFHPHQYNQTRDRYPQLDQEQINGGHDLFIEYAETTADWISKFHKQHNPSAISASQQASPPHFLPRPNEVMSVEGEKPFEVEKA